MRIALTLVLAAVIALAALAVIRGDDAGTGGTGSVTLVGDSLNVGIEPYLDDELPGWRLDLHDRVGRTTEEGIEELRDLEGRLAPVVVVSLGTNDAERTELEFRRLVEEAVEIVGPDRCLVWATIVRAGAPRTGFNEVLRQAQSLHAGLRLVDWATLVEQDDSLLAADLVHGTPEGYARRAEQTARVVGACSGSDD